jgi:hypothetical protein
VDSLGDKVRSFLVPHFDEYSRDVNSLHFWGTSWNVFYYNSVAGVGGYLSTFEHTNWFGYWFLF